MKKYLIGILLLLSTNAHAATIALGTISADATPGGFNNNFTILANAINGNIEGSTDSGASVSNIKAASVFRINMASDADPATFAKETESITVDTTSSSGAFVYSGCTPATDTDLTSDISACVAYINGIRVSKAATSQTYTASKDTYVDLSQTGVYTLSAVALGASAPTVAANSARLAKVVTSGTQITSVTDLSNRRLPGLLIPSHYRTGMNISRDSATTITVFPGTVEVNSTMVNKTAVTTLTLGTAGDWAGGTGLSAANTYGYVGIDTSGNLKMHTTAPTHDNYAVSTTVGKKRYATWSSTVYRILGWFYMNSATQINSGELGNIKEGDVGNSNISNDSTVNNFTSTSFLPVNDIKYYSSGGPILLQSNISGDSAAGQNFAYGTHLFVIDGTSQPNSGNALFSNSDSGLNFHNVFMTTLSQGTHTIQSQAKINTGTWTMRDKKLLVLEQ